MNLLSRKGDKVIFLDENGYDIQLENAKKCGLIKGEAYTINDVSIGSFKSEVNLVEFPNAWFNTVMFDNKKNNDVDAWNGRQEEEEK